MEESSRRRPSLVGPLILIGLGVIFLLNNLGVIDWSVWDVVFRLWPVLIIAVGLDLLIGRRSAWGALLSLVLMVAIVAGAVWLYATVVADGGPASGESVRQALGDVDEARVEIDPAVGTLRVDALPESANLVEGTVGLWRNEVLEQDYDVDGRRATLTLHSGGSTVFVGPAVPYDRVWDLGLSPGVPLDLALGLGMGQAEVDLTGLQLSALDVDLGLGQGTVILPAEGSFSAQIDGAIGQTVVVVPSDLAVRIRVSTGIAARSLPSGYQRDGDVYTSPGYDDAEQRAELQVNQAIGSLVVRTQP